MSRFRILLVVIIVLLSVALGFFLYASEQTGRLAGRFPFQFGLDLAGGTELVYQADTSALKPVEIDDAMTSLRQVIERRVNSQDFSGAFGVLEPVVRIEKAGFLTGEISHRLTVELPGVTEIEKAKEFIGRTPVLEFKLVKEPEPNDSRPEQPGAADLFIQTGLDGRRLNRAQLEFDQVTGQPLVALSFNREGRDLFAEITRNNVGEILAIFLDGQPISLPVIREEIRDGNAQISGDFKVVEAKELVRNLNLGALPLPIELVQSQKIGPTLGAETVSSSFRAGLWGLLLVAVFMILWYRLPGLLAVFSLIIYLLLMLGLFKLIPITLTAAGLAGLILSIGMAVDANVLVFARLREELATGRKIQEAVVDGFRRAWPSIRDANISSLITAIILFWFGSSLIQGFALVFGLGILASMFSAVVVTRLFLLSLSAVFDRRSMRFLFGRGR